MADLDVRLRIGAQVNEATQALKGLQRDLQRLDSVRLQRAGRQITQFGQSISRAGRQLTLFVTGPLALLAGGSLRAFDQQAKAVAQLETGIRSTGAAAGFTAQELQKVASQLQGVTTFGDEDILQNVTSQLLTFTNIAGDQFLKTQELALDLATRLGGDLQSATIQLGKALNDPVANLSALSRAGIQFSKDQRETIKTLVETNRLADAQTVILKELENQFGGSARAAAEAGLGPLTQLRNSIGDLSEDIGAILAPAVNSLATRLKEVIESFRSASPAVQRTVVIIGGLVAVVGPLLVVLGAIVSSVGLLVTGFGSLGTIISRVVLGPMIALLNVLRGIVLILSPAAIAIGVLVAGLVEVAGRVAQLNQAGLSVSNSFKVLGLDFLIFIQDLLRQGNEFFSRFANRFSGLVERLSRGTISLGRFSFETNNEENLAILRTQKQALLDQAGITEEDAENFTSGIGFVRDKIVEGLSAPINTVSDQISGLFGTPPPRELETGVEQLASDIGEVSKQTEGFRERLAKLKVNSPADIGLTAAQSAANGLSRTFSAIGDGTKKADEAFKDFARNFLQQIGEMIVQAALLQAIQGAFAAASGTTSGNSTTVNSGAGVANIAASGGFVSGGQIAQRFAEGGAVIGPGSGTSDSIPAMLSNGEFVTDARTVGFFGKNFFSDLKRIARGGIFQPNFGGVARFNEGGFVGGRGSEFLNNQQSSTAQSGMSVEVINNGSRDVRVDRVEQQEDAGRTVMKIFIDDLKVNGAGSQALQSAFGLRRRGFK